MASHEADTAPHTEISYSSRNIAESNASIYKPPTRIKRPRPIKNTTPPPLSSHVEVPHSIGHYGYGKYDPDDEMEMEEDFPDKDVVPDYMSLALFSSIFCFWPLGIIAVLKNKKARRLKLGGDVYNAKKQARSAKVFLIWAIVVGIFVYGVAIGVGVGVIVDVRHKYFG